MRHGVLAFILALPACFDPDDNGADVTGSGTTTGTNGSTLAETTGVTTSSGVTTESETSPDPDTTAGSTGASNDTTETESTTAAHESDGTGETSASSSGCDDACVPCEEPLQMCGGSCMDTRTEPEHCGSCERSCASGSCIDGGCEPEVLVAGESPIFGLTAHGSFVYFLQRGSSTDTYLYRVPASGGDATAIAWTFQPLEQLLADTSSIYAVQIATSTMVRTPLAGSELDGSSNFTELNPEDALPTTLRALTMNETELFFIGVTQSASIHRLAKAGGTNAFVSTSGTPIGSRALVVDETHAYALSTTADALYAVPLQGGDVVPMAGAGTQESLLDLAATQDYVVFGSDRRGGIVPKAGGDMSTVLEGGPLYRVIAGPGTSSAFFLHALGDETCSEGSALYAVEVPGGAPQKLATIPADGGCVPFFTYTATRVFWSNHDATTIFSSPW